MHHYSIQDHSNWRQRNHVKIYSNISQHDYCVYSNVIWKALKQKRVQYDGRCSTCVAPLRWIRFDIKPNIANGSISRLSIQKAERQPKDPPTFKCPKHPIKPSWIEQIVMSNINTTMTWDTRPPRRILQTRQVKRISALSYLNSCQEKNRVTLKLRITYSIWPSRCKRLKPEGFQFFRNEGLGERSTPHHQRHSRVLFQQGCTCRKEPATLNSASKSWHCSLRLPQALPNVMLNKESNFT